MMSVVQSTPDRVRGDDESRVRLVSSAVNAARLARSQRRPIDVLIFLPYLPDAAPGQRFRIEQWARALESSNVRFDVVTFESAELKRIIYTQGRRIAKSLALARCITRQLKRVLFLQRKWDVIFLFRELLPIGPPVLERLLVRKGIPVVYDFDDAIFLADVSEANRHFGWLKRPQKVGAICRMSTHVIVGNAYLQSYVLQHTPHVSIVPTTIDTQRYTMKERVAIQGQPVIGWSGSLTTSKHLRTVLPALQLLRRSYEFRLKVIGGEVPAMSDVAVERQPWRAETEVEDLQSFDIGIMPLPDDPWSRGKCGLKALQYMAVGVPTVASPVGVNAEIIQDGENGFLASTQQEWVNKLSRLLNDEALRRSVATQGRRTVEERYSTAVQVPRVLDILERACGRYSSPLTVVGRREEAVV